MARPCRGLTVERDPVRFKAALIGIQLADWDGGDGTSQYLDDIVSPTHREAALARFTLVARSGRWYADAGCFLAPRRTTASLHRLLLPCADDGATVDRIVAAIFPDR